MNRLKTMRKVKDLTQKQVADFVGITQNAYCYWELGKVRVDGASYQKLASFYGVSTDFLMGIPYKLSHPVSAWSDDEKEDYKSANEYEKIYLEYRYGKPIFLTSAGEKGAPAENSQPPLQNGIVVCREGSEERLPMTQEQLALFDAFLAAYKKNS